MIILAHCSVHVYMSTMVTFIHHIQVCTYNILIHFLTYDVPSGVTAAFKTAHSTGVVCLSSSSKASHWKSFRKLQEVPRKVDILMEHNLLHSSSMMYAMVFSSTFGLRSGKGQPAGPHLGILDGLASIFSSS